LLSSSELAEKISSQAFKEVGKYTWNSRAQNIINFISI